MVVALVTCSFFCATGLGDVTGGADAVAEATGFVMGGLAGLH
jgi:hypothetical protein